MIPSSVVVTEDHLKLLRRMFADWDDCEYGAPQVDPKRPYGNSDVTGDIHEILGWPIPVDENGDRDETYMEDEGWKRARKIHLELEGVLQVLLRVGNIPTGTYLERNRYHGDYELVKEKQ